MEKLRNDFEIGLLIVFIIFGLTFLVMLVDEHNGREKEAIKLLMHRYPQCATAHNQYECVRFLEVANESK
jgi:hypothetical protein